MEYQDSLKKLKPGHQFFIGIDSDGCVFDSMEVKQKEFFIPNALKYFNLFAISKQLRETWEFVNLYSIHRGGNRFTSIIRVFDLLEEREDIKRTNVKLPDLTTLRTWIGSETKLGNATLRKYYEAHPDKELEKVLVWTEAVNHDIGEWLRDIPPFPDAKKAIKVLSQKADLIIVSQTPLEALHREWEEHDLKRYINVIAGQEHGSKTEHIALSAKGKYDDKKILMIGDAKGDLDAAKNNGVLFYPIIPGKENESWKIFLNEGFARFTEGAFAGEYENKLLKEFRNSLPEKPTWVL
jgi:phosphoglycolate phosphatase-like HAD superfamily hydrolase